MAKQDTQQQQKTPQKQGAPPGHMPGHEQKDPRRQREEKT